MFLSEATFKTVIENTPLISIDLLVKNKVGDILLGRRKNRPAEKYWFVPGGRILKGETIAQAFARLSLNELGQQMEIDSAQFIGPFEHFYNDCVFGEGASTHYVVLAYSLTVHSLNGLPKEQHSNFKWFEIEHLLANDNVHKHTKAYF